MTEKNKKQFKKSDSVNPSEKNKNKKKIQRSPKKDRFFSRLNINIPIPPVLMMILPSFSVKALEEGHDISADKSVPNHESAQSDSKRNVVAAAVSNHSEKQSSNPTIENEATPAEGKVAPPPIHSSHHLSASPSPIVSLVANTTSTNNIIDNNPAGLTLSPLNTPITATSVAPPLTYTSEVIVGKYGSLTVDSSGKYTFTLDPHSPDYICLQNKEPATDTFTTHLSNGTTAVVHIPLQGQQNHPTISGELVGTLVEDTNVDSHGLLTSLGKIDVVDADHDQSGMQAETLHGQYGTLSINENGHWQYVVDNTQSTIQALTNKTSLSEVFTVHTTDGTAQTLQMSIGGKDDNALITGIDSGVTTEELNLTASGKLDIIDGDTGEQHFSNTDIVGALGTLHLTDTGAWTYDLDNTNPTVQALGKGANATDVITVHSADGTPHHITITVNGTNDKAIIGGTVAGQVSEESALQTMGKLTVTDTDTGEQHFSNTDIVGALGTLHLTDTGAWTYDLDNTNPTVQALGQGSNATDVITVNSVDGTPHQITITVNGTNDKAVIGGSSTGQVTEESVLQTSGSLTITDTDTGEQHFSNTDIVGALGTLHLTNSGAWTYDLDNSNPAVQALAKGDSTTDTVTVQSVDGTPQQITITVNGTNDKAVIGGSSTGQVTEESALQTSGSLTVTDTDTGEQHFSNTDIVGALGTLHLTNTGAWTYDLDNTNPTVQALGKGANATDVITVNSVDGTPQQITITVNGTNDKAIIGGTVAGQVTEESALQTTGSLTITDTDTGEQHFSNTYIVGALGTLHLTDTGAWTYDLDNTNPTVQALGKGANATDVITVNSVDGTPHQITITVNGTNDKAVIGGSSTGQVTEESVLQTTGSLTITDTDTGEQHFSNTDIVGALGTLHLTDTGAWTYDLDNTNPTVQALGKDDMTTDTVTVHSADGTTHHITIAVNGTNDKAVIGGSKTGQVTEESALQTSGTLTVIDTDTGEQHFSNTDIAGALGTLHLTDKGDWTYDLDNTNPTVQALGKGDMTTDTVTVQSVDGTAHQITITVNGSNDKAVIGGVDTGNVTEDVNTYSNVSASANMIYTRGQLTIGDADSGENNFDFKTFTHVATNPEYAPYISQLGGRVSMTKTGEWEYEIDTTKANIQALGAGEILKDSVIIESADGTEHTIDIAIHGTNDAPVVSQEAVLLVGTEDTDMRITQVELLTYATDIDHNDINQLTVDNLHVDHGSISTNADGNFTFSPDKNYNGVVHFTYDVKDSHGGVTNTGATTNLAAVNDVSILASPLASAEVTEDNTPSAISNELTSFWNNLDTTDVDGSNEADIVQIEINGVVHQIPADFALNLQGDHGFFTTTHSSDSHNKWRYTADNSNPDIQGLKDGQSLTDSMTLITADGTRIPIIATIKGIDDNVIIDTPASTTASLGTLIEDSKTSESGVLLAHDSDTDDSVHFEAQSTTGIYGALSVNKDGTWHYDLDSSKANSLGAGDFKAEGFDVVAISSDGSKATQHIQVTVQGTNDQAVITGQDSALVTEDVNAREINTVNKLAPIHHGIGTNGVLTVTDSDTGEAHFISQQTAQAHGTFILTTSGHWHYTVDNSLKEVQSLGLGQVITDKIEITSADGTIHSITVTIQGSNDAPTCTSEVTLQLGSEDTDIILTQSQLITNSHDIDNNDQGMLRVDSVTANHGSVSKNSDGSFTFHPDKNYNGDVHFTYDVKDAHGGITHTGANTSLAAVNDNPDNVPVVDSVTEDTDPHHAVNLLGTATDVDGDPLSISQIQISFEGSTGGLPKGVTFASDGHSLIIDSHSPTFQHLAAGEKSDIVVHYMVDDNQGGQTAAVATVTMIGSDDKAQLQSSTIDMTESQALHTYYQLGSKVGGTLKLVDPDTNDHTQFAFSGDSGTQGYGNLTIWPDGRYEYDLDMARNHHANDKVASLKAGETLTDQYQIRTNDGQTKVITVTIHGEDNNARIEVSMPNILPTSQQITEEHFVNASSTHLYAGGMLKVIDPDHGDAYLQSETISTAHQGEFKISSSGSWSYTIDNSIDKVQHLGAGESFTETHTVHSLDGTASQLLTVTVHGTNDAPLVSAQVKLAPGTEDTDIHLTKSDLLINTTDIDHNDIGQLGVANLVADHGAIITNKDGSYTLHPEKDYNGQVHFSYDVQDAHSGVTHTGATTTLSAVKDQAIVSGDITGNAFEDHNIYSQNHIEVTGHLLVTAPDAGQQGFQYTRSTSVSDPFGGSLHISASGTWTYDVDNAKLQHLGANQEVLVTHRVYTTDGTAQDIIIKVTGSNDAPVVSSEVVLQTGTEDTDIILSQAQLLANTTDIDDNDLNQLHIDSVNANHGLVTKNTDGSFTFHPDQDYNGQVHFSYEVKDGHSGITQATAMTSLAAVQDNAVITGQDSGSVTEDRHVSPAVSWFGNMIETQGQLHITDADSGENHFELRSFITDAMHPERAPYTSVLGGHLEIGHNGSWGYKIDTSNAIVQKLGAGETAIDKVVVHSIDGTEHEIQITIHGTNDAPFCSSEVQLNRGTEDTDIILTSAQLLANSSDIDANDLGQLSVANLTADHGSIVDNKDGTFSFNPAKNYNGNVHFSYDIKDGHSGVTHTGATTSLAAVNDNPDVLPLTDSVNEGDSHHHNLDLLLGATDKEGDLLSINQLSYSVDGSPSTTQLPAGLSLAADGHSIIVDATNPAYEHLANGQSLKIEISYLVEDGHGGQSQQRADLTIQGTDDKATLVSNVIQLTETQAIDSQHNMYKGTLQLVDPDSSDKTHFEYSGTYLGQGFPPGDLTVRPDGSYQFTLQSANNRYADDLIASLRTGESMEIPYEIKTSDGQALTIMVKVIGEDNQARIEVAPYSSLTNHAYEDRTSASTPNQIWSGGNLHVIDPDHDQAGFVAQRVSTPEGGNFHINPRGDWAYTIDNSKLQHMGTGESFQKTFTVESIDGSAHQNITVTVHGTNDAPIITSAVSLAKGTEDTAIHISQEQLLTHASDIDDNDLHQLHIDSVSVDHGAITQNADGSYTFQPSANYNGDVHFSYDVKDAHSGVTHTSASTTLSAVQDQAIVSGDVTGDVIEDHDIFTGDMIEVTGHVFVADPDAGQQGFQYRRTTSVDDPFGGTLHISSGGTWTYDVDNAKLQHLAANEEVLITHRIYTLDGTAQDIVIKVTGTNDKPVVTEVQHTHSITEDAGNSTSGQITISDVDHSDQHSVNIDSQHPPQYGSVSYNNATQTWVYTLNNNNANVNALNDGDRLTDKFSILVNDGHGGTTTQEIEMNINGHSDIPPMPTLVAPARITGGAGHQDLHASIGIPPIVPQGTPTPVTGWGISDNHGHSLSSLHGQYGTLHINPATGELNYDYQSSSSVIKTHTGGSYGSGSDQTDSFLLTLGGNQNSQVAVHLHLHSQSVHGNSGHHIDQTTLTGMDISPINAPAPSPATGQHDEPDFTADIDVDIVLSDDTLHIDAIASHVNADQHTDVHPVTGAMAYLDALGISPTAPTFEDTEPALPADMDIVMAEADHLALSYNDSAHLDSSDALEHHQHDLNQDDHDDTQHHYQIDELPDIDPNS